MPVFIQDAIKVQCAVIVFEVANAYSAKLTPTCNLDIRDEYLCEAATLIRSLPSMKFNLQLQIAIHDTKIIII